MKLTPREIDHLMLHNAGFLAQKRMARGIRLNLVEAIALLASQVMELIRDGRSVAELMDIGRTMLGTRQGINNNNNNNNNNRNNNHNNDNNDDNKLLVINLYKHH
jgi:urease gamma subunit